MKDIQNIKYSHYSFTGDRKTLLKNGWKMNRHEGISYSRDDINKYGFFMYSAGGMEIEMGRFCPYKHSQIIEFILDNKDKPDSFWIKETEEPLHNMCNWVMLEDHTILTFEDNIERAKIDIIKELGFKESEKDAQYFETVNRFARTGAIHASEIRFELSLVNIIKELDNISPLKKVIY